MEPPNTTGDEHHQLADALVVGNPLPPFEVRLPDRRDPGVGDDPDDLRWLQSNDGPSLLPADPELHDQIGLFEWDRPLRVRDGRKGGSRRTTPSGVRAPGSSRQTG